MNSKFHNHSAVITNGLSAIHTLASEARSTSSVMESITASSEGGSAQFYFYFYVLVLLVRFLESPNFDFQQKEKRMMYKVEITSID